MSDIILDHPVKAPQSRFAQAQCAASQTPAPDSWKDLLLELADLRATVEKLRHQNAELATIRQALDAEHQRYREVFELAPDGHVLTDLDGVIREANRAAVALLSVREGFLTGKSLLIFVDEAEQAALMAQVAPWRNTGYVQTNRLPGTIRGQTQLRVLKGAAFPAEYTISPARDGHGQIIGLRWILRDLSENTQIQQALQQREYHYRTLFDNAGDAILIHNLTGRYLDANRTACKCLGYTREELLQLTPADINAPEIVEQFPALVAKLRQGDPVFLETVIVRRDGTTFPAELNSRMIDYAGGPAVLSIARDITERKRAEQALMRRTAQLALLSDIGRRIAAVLGLEQVLERAAQLVQDSFGYHHVALFLIDQQRHELTMKARAGDFVKLFPPEHRIPLGRGMVGWVGQHGQRLLTNNVQAESHYINFYPDVIPTCSELSVPIQIGTQTVGVLDVQSPHFDAFDENDVKVMEILADQIAVAIANARLYEAARREHGENPPAAHRGADRDGARVVS